MSRTPVREPSVASCIGTAPARAAEIIQIVEAREEVESAIAGRAAKRITPEQLAELSSPTR